MDSENFPPRIPLNVPTPARVYDYNLGGKDNFAVDREVVLAAQQQFPEILDIARQNRLFLYRVVRFLAREAGIRQFLDLGSGLPTQQNVHQVAQRFRPDAKVVYVDNDPIVLVHGRAMLAENGSTTVVQGDLARPEEILADEEVRDLIDFGRPVGALFLSVLHSIVDDGLARGAVRGFLDAMCPGSYLAVSQFVVDDDKSREEALEMSRRLGMEVQGRTSAQVKDFLSGTEMIDPGLVDVNDWRPDPGQPPLEPVDKPLRPYLGASKKVKRMHEYGGVVRKP